MPPMSNNAANSMFSDGCDGFGTCDLFGAMTIEDGRVATAAVVDNRPLDAFFHGSPSSQVLDGSELPLLIRRSGGFRIKNRGLQLDRATGVMSIQNKNNNNSVSCIQGSAAADRAAEAVRLCEAGDVGVFVETITSEALDNLFEQDSDAPTETDSRSTLGSGVWSRETTAGDDAADLATRLRAEAPPPVQNGLVGGPAERKSGRVKIKNRNVNGNETASKPAVPTGVPSSCQFPHPDCVARELLEVYHCLPDASSLPLPNFVARSM
mmetsp:Transcript_96185/g.276324  ORF Transcript_96185/g.276324 Transcript_96185/m.276324 type:complete len:266 (-) Transcript_96185:170-967(-)